MIPELGHFALILALCLTMVQVIAPLAGLWRGVSAWVALAVPAARGQLLFMLLAYASLTYAFISHDFSVAYVAHNSNTELPLLYRISGVWGAHEGSLLLWALVLSIWTDAVTWFSGSVPEAMRARVLAVMGLVSIGFLLFMLLTSNPFDRLFPVPLQGRDLNPLLQDPGLAIHPPMLYMGYVGFSVAFAFAIAALLAGRLDSAWARWSRPWTLVAWLFLTLGIALGSWWAYYELGWGGWWFWDPVENASFMPWLVGTALIHSLAVTEKRGLFKAWTVLLAVFAFSLSLLGTFLVRSGVLTSVHAFATDPTRGVFILIFLVMVVGGSLALYAWRAPLIRSVSDFEPLSRETSLLMNNLLLVVTAASILLGTLYPLFVDALGLGKLSVGPPYFNTVFVPLMAPLALLIGFGIRLRWKQDRLARLLPELWLPAGISLLAGLLLPLLMPRYSLAVAAALALALWIVLSTLQQLWQRRKLPLAFWGMSVAHLGVAMFVTGVTLTSAYSIEKDVRLAPGESVELGGYRFRFEGVQHRDGVNYQADAGTVVVSREGTPVARLVAEKRTYRVQRMPMTEAAIDASLTRDLFVALGEPLGSAGAWSLRLYHKPFIRWIWVGCLVMACGGLLAALDPRYRLQARRLRQAAAAASGARA